MKDGVEAELRRHGGPRARAGLGCHRGGGVGNPSSQPAEPGSATMRCRCSGWRRLRDCLCSGGRKLEVNVHDGGRSELDSEHDVGGMAEISGPSPASMVT